MPDWRITELDEPDWGLDSSSVPEGEFYVLSWIQLDECVFDDSRGRRTTYRFPLFSHQDRLLLDLDQPVLRMHAAARRVRNYLAVEFGSRFTLHYRFKGKGVLMHGSFMADEMGIFIAEGWDKKTPEEARADVSERLFRVGHRLESVEVDSFTDKVINLLGSSIWSDDAVDGYMYRWRILELTGDEEVAKITPRRAGVLGTYLGDDVTSALARSLRSADKIRMAVDKYAPWAETEKLKKCARTRNSIAHGSFSAGIYEEVFENDRTVAPLSQVFTGKAVEHFVAGDLYVDLSALGNLYDDPDQEDIVAEMRRRGLFVWPGAVCMYEIAKCPNQDVRTGQLELLNELRGDRIPMGLPTRIFHKAAEAAREGRPRIVFSFDGLVSVLEDGDFTEEERERASSFLGTSQEDFATLHGKGREALKSFAKRNGVPDTLGERALQFVEDHWMRPEFLDLFFQELMHNQLRFPRKFKPHQYLRDILSLRLYVEAQGCAIYSRGIQREGHSDRKNPGLPDLQQLAYLGCPEIRTFVTSDGPLLRDAGILTNGRIKGKEVIGYEELRSRLI